jgi:hypothetical protein
LATLAGLIVTLPIDALVVVWLWSGGRESQRRPGRHRFPAQC